MSLDTPSNTSHLDSAESVDVDEGTWKNPPKLADLKKDLSEALNDHTLQMSKINTWLDNLNITGKAKRSKVMGRSSIVPKLIRKQAEWRYASLSDPFLSTEDLFNVSPVSFEDKQSAEQNELVLNNQFNTKLSKVRFIDEYIRALVNEGTVIVQVGWDYQTTEEVVPVPITEQQIVSNPDGSQGIEEVVVGFTSEKQEVVKVNQPTVTVVDIHKLIIDPTADTLAEANFIINEFDSSISSLTKSGKYENLDKINVENSSTSSGSEFNEEEEDTFTFSDRPRKQITVYEYWGNWDVFDTGMVEPIVVAWVGDTVIRAELNPFPDGKHPFVSEQYLPTKKSIYGEPDGELLEDNQKVIGAVTRSMIDILGRGANGQTGVLKGALDITNLRKFKRGDDYEYNSGSDPRGAIYQHTMADIPSSAEYMLNNQQNEADSLTGIQSFSGGLSGKGLGNTATSVRGVLDATATRELGILRRAANGITEIGRKMISMNAKWLSDEEVVRITNEEFVEIRRDDLAGNFDLKLSISTAEVDNSKAQELAFMLQTGAASADPGEVRMIRAEIARLRKMPALAKRIEEYQPQPDPVAQRKAELEVALLEAQISNEQAKAAENTVDVQLKQAKTRNLESKSDQQDLDFLDKETGADRQHEMDLKEVDKGNELDLKTADRLLSSDIG